MENRNIGIMILLIIITFGWYSLYWIVKTKLDLSDQGACIPSCWLLIIPIANIYFLYKFAEAFGRTIIKNEQMIIVYFLLILLILPVGALIYQDKINTYLTQR